MKLLRRMAVWSLVPVMGAVCQGDARTGDSITSPSEILLQCISVIPASASVAVGDTIRFTANTCKNITGSDYRWSTAEPAIADVDSLSGLVRAKGAGSTTIVATLVQNRNFKGAAAVEVFARPSFIQRSENAR
jgi:uncharacterized protein YjdB